MSDIFALFVGVFIGGVLGVVTGKYVKLFFSWIIFKLNIR
jgi:hypothetical protein